jgi:hypothetical protein
MIATRHPSPSLIPWTVLFFALLAISISLNFSILDSDGSQIKSLFTSSWADFEAANGEAERSTENAANTRTPLMADWTSGSRSEDILSLGPSIQPRRRRILPYPSRTTPRGSHDTSLSADPA